MLKHKLQSFSKQANIHSLHPRVTSSPCFSVRVIHSFIQKSLLKTVNAADILEETKRYHSQVFSSILRCLKCRI